MVPSKILESHNLRPCQGLPPFKDAFIVTWAFMKTGADDRKRGEFEWDGVIASSCKTSM